MLENFQLEIDKIKIQLKHFIKNSIDFNNKNYININDFNFEDKGNNLGFNKVL